MVLAMGSFTIFSCSEDDSVDDNEMGGVCSDFQTDWTGISDALTAYSENPTVQNCENYKSALREFYSAYADCAFWGPQYQEAIDSIDDIDCSESGT